MEMVNPVNRFFFFYLGRTRRLRRVEPSIVKCEPFCSQIEYTVITALEGVGASCGVKQIDKCLGYV